MPEVCVPIPIPKAGAPGVPEDFDICSTCPQYGFQPLDCTGWTSADDTIVLPSGVPKPCTKYTSTGCKNQTILPPDPSGGSEFMRYSVDLWYPVGSSQDPARIAIHQDIVASVPNVGVIETRETSTMDITKFEVGSLSHIPHCNP